MNTDSFLSMLQFTDALFPAGAYAHSFGLEFCVQAGSVRDAVGVEAFLWAYLEGTCGPTDALVSLCASRAGRLQDFDGCIALDGKLDAIKVPSESRNASRQMGRQILRVLIHTSTDAFVTRFGGAITDDVTPGHHAVCFGIAGAILNWPEEALVSSYLYAASSALVGAALRLLPLGQLVGQKILSAARPRIAKLASDLHERDGRDLWSFAPAQEIAAMKHANLEARLFRS
jgi:urease accessory protein